MQIFSLILLGTFCVVEDGPGPMPETTRLVVDEDWSSGRIDPARWYVLRKHWGAGNHGVVPQNVRIDRDIVQGRERNVLVCTAHGDRYTGPVKGLGGNTARVGGVLVSKPFLASGRYEVVMRIGPPQTRDDGTQPLPHPSGAVPAIWTYGYRFVQVDPALQDRFVPDAPLYNPHMKAYGTGANEYWSELDFPEFGKAGDFSRGLYNTFCQNRHESRTFDVSPATDGRYHTLTTEWRTRLQPLAGITDAQVVESMGYWWICDVTVPFERYLGNPLKRLNRDSYALYTGEKAVHWIDGRRIGENRRYVPAMAAQLNLGVWLPQWAGPAPWETAEVRFASVRVWQYDDPGDVRGILVDDITNNFAPDGHRLP